MVTSASAVIIFLLEIECRFRELMHLGEGDIFGDIAHHVCRGNVRSFAVILAVACIGLSPVALLTLSVSMSARARGIATHHPAHALGYPPCYETLQPPHDVGQAQPPHQQQYQYQYESTHLLRLSIIEYRAYVTMDQKSPDTPIHITITTVVTIMSQRQMLPFSP